MLEDIHTVISDLADAWGHLDDAATTHTMLRESHPNPLSWRSPTRFSIMSLDDAIVEAVCQAAAAVDMSVPDHAEELHREILQTMAVIERRLNCPEWAHSGTDVVALLSPVLERARRLLGETTRPAFCPDCGSAVTASDNVLNCPQCGDMVAPVGVTVNEAAVVLGKKPNTVARAIKRHNVVAVSGSWPHKYRFSQVSALFSNTPVSIESSQSVANHMQLGDGS